MLIKSLESAETLVDSQQALGNDVFWDGWDMVFFKPDARAIYSAQGAFKGGSWGFANRFKLNADGHWDIDHRNIRRERYRR